MLVGLAWAKENLSKLIMEQKISAFKLLGHPEKDIKISGNGSFKATSVKLCHVRL